jgi:hypothetical protein
MASTAVGRPRAALPLMRGEKDMRSGTITVMSAAAAVTVLALVPARAAAPVTMEKSLLGIRILQTYKDVLARLGQPKVIVTGGEGPFRDRAVDPSGNFVGAIQDVVYGDSASTGGGGGGMMGAKGGGMGVPGMGPMGPMGAMTGGGGMMGMGKKGDGGGGAPAMPGGAPGTGGMVGGGAGGGSSASSGTFKDAGGYAWWYHNRFEKTAYSFYFNLEGRVLGILEEGVKGGTPTSRGIKLGSTIKDLYTTYGWPDTIQELDAGFILDYGSKYHAKFAVIKEKVVGIGIVLNESQEVPFVIAEGGSGGAGGGGKSGGPAGPGGGVGGPPIKGGGGGFAPRGPGGVGGANSHAD